MSNEELRQQLKGIQSAYDSKYDVVENVAQEGLSSLKSKIGKMDIQFESKKPTPTERPQAKFTHLDIADRATATYKEKINPGVYKADDVEQPITHSTRTSMRAMASSLAGMRSSGNAGKMTQSTPNGNGDLGQYTSPANNNDGDLGNNTGYGQYYSLTTNMSMEEYQEHINSKFTKEVEASPLVETICSTCGCSPCECEVDEPLAQLKESLLQLEDSAWQSIDLVMREEANELGVTPKELHKFFKQETGLIPDDWLKENREVQLFGFMPLDEATAINKVGQVYDVTCMWRGNTMRLKFFWPQLGICSKDECQNACEMFYPGSRLIAYYPCKDEPDNYMVIVPPIKESCEFVPLDTWFELDEETDELFQQICEEVGEPVTPPVEQEDGSYKVVVEDHDNGEELVVMFEKRGLWDNIHAKRKRGESPAKKGDKDYPKTLNVEGLEQAKKNVGASSCWDGYKAKGTKKKNGKEVPNCVKEGDEMKGMSQKSGDKRSTDSGAGMTAKGVAKYNARTGGDLKTAVTTPPSKLKAGSKAAGRRKSFCARSRGWNGERGKAARRRWNC
jgi:hypothetical protein